MAHRLDRIMLIVFGLSLLLLIVPRYSRAHNGAVAIAMPIEGITVDGDLSDWPGGMVRYPVANVINGPHPESDEDFQGVFRIGYSAQKNALYVALEIQDESWMSRGTQTHEQDGCDLFIDWKHRDRFSPVFQFAMWGEARQALQNGQIAEWNHAELAIRRDNNKRWYVETRT